MENLKEDEHRIGYVIQDFMISICNEPHIVYRVCAYKPCNPNDPDGELYKDDTKTESFSSFIAAEKYILESLQEHVVTNNVEIEFRISTINRREMN